MVVIIIIMEVERVKIYFYEKNILCIAHEEHTTRFLAHIDGVGTTISNKVNILHTAL